MNKLTIKEMQQIAKNKGGRCLSKEYINVYTKLKWECHKGHIWNVAPRNIKRGQWCPYCAINNQKLTIDDMQRLAKKCDGECLSKKYINNYTKLKWQCRKGHIWGATPSDIKNNKWCPKCAGTARLTIEEMQKLAAKREGKCLSRDYTNNYTKLKWQCKEGHVWEAAPKCIKSGTWCPKCALSRVDSISKPHFLRNIGHMKIIAEERGGKCLSTKYRCIDDKLKWQCREGHVWEAMPSNLIHRGSWCPYCAGNKKLTIQEMQKLAKKRDGKCLSLEYVNTVTKLTWQCKGGHIWEALPNNIKRGSWCPTCANKLRGNRK